MCVLSLDPKVSEITICIPVTSFFYLISVARTSNTVLNETGESRPSYFAPNFGGRVFSDSGCMVLGLTATSCS